MFPMTMTIHNADQLKLVMGALADGAKPKDEPQKTETTKSTGKPTAATASSPRGAEPECTAPKADAPAPVVETVGESEKVYELKDAKALTLKAVSSGKRNGVIELLKKYEVAQAALLKAEQIDAFCQDVEELLK